LHGTLEGYIHNAEQNTDLMKDLKDHQIEKQFMIARIPFLVVHKSLHDAILFQIEDSVPDDPALFQKLKIKITPYFIPEVQKVEYNRARLLEAHKMGPGELLTEQHWTTVADNFLFVFPPAAPCIIKAFPFSQKKVCLLFGKNMEATTLLKYRDTEISSTKYYLTPFFLVLFVDKSEEIQKEKFEFGWVGDDIDKIPVLAQISTYNLCENGVLLIGQYLNFITDILLDGEKVKFENVDMQNIAFVHAKSAPALLETDWSKLVVKKLFKCGYDSPHGCDVEFKSVC